MYVTVVGALLFLAFAYFAVGQAVAARSDAQGAADAAALAAANEAREQIGQDLLDGLQDLADWGDLIAGRPFPIDSSCAQAEAFAAKNGAVSESCIRTVYPISGFTVKVKVLDPVGSSVIPGTGSQRATASATAVIEPLCDLTTAPDGYSEGDLINLACEGRAVEIDPGDEEPLPSLSDLFRVRLVE